MTLDSFCMAYIVKERCIKCISFSLHPIVILKGNLLSDKTNQIKILLKLSNNKLNLLRNKNNFLYPFGNKSGSISFLSSPWNLFVAALGITSFLPENKSEQRIWPRKIPTHTLSLTASEPSGIRLHLSWWVSGILIFFNFQFYKYFTSFHPNDKVSF